MTRLLTAEKYNQIEQGQSLEIRDLRKSKEKDITIIDGDGKCTVSGCPCVSFVDPPGGFDCVRCGHRKSDHW